MSPYQKEALQAIKDGGGSCRRIHGGYFQLKNGEMLRIKGLPVPVQTLRVLVRLGLLKFEDTSYFKQTWGVI